MTNAPRQYACRSCGKAHESEEAADRCEYDDLFGPRRCTYCGVEIEHGAVSNFCDPEHRHWYQMQEHEEARHRANYGDD